MEKTKDSKEKEKKKVDHAQELLEEMIRDGNKNYAETTCDVDRIRGEEHMLAEKNKKKKK
jgi:hypothetical protein